MCGCENLSLRSRRGQTGRLSVFDSWLPKGIFGPKREKIPEKLHIERFVVSIIYLVFLGWFHSGAWDKGGHVIRMAEWLLQTKSQSKVFWSKFCLYLLTVPYIPPPIFFLFCFITLLLFIEALHYAVFSSLLLPLLHVSKIHLFSSARRSSSVGSLSATRNQEAPL
jgi:hypothetical protein